MWLASNATAAFIPNSVLSRSGMTPMPQVHSSAADCNLLFGVLALQMDFIDREALVKAMSTWVNDKTKPLGHIFRDQGSLSQDELALLDALVAKHLQKHGNDPGKSLAA